MALIKLFLLGLWVYLTNANSQVCKLTGEIDGNPSPSLTQCYKFNSDACCGSVHDNYINDFISNLLTSPCQRKFGELNDLFCYGCNPQEYVFTNSGNNTISICRSFVMQLWNATTYEDLSKPTTRFDSCGFKVNQNSPSSLQALTDKPYIIPSQTFANVEDFVLKVTIPFFDNYTLNIIDDTNITDPTGICYTAAAFLKTSFTLLFFIGILVLLF